MCRRFQCEQTAMGTGCTKAGVCGKDAATAALQDLLLYAAKGISMYARRARELGAADREVDVFALVSGTPFPKQPVKDFTPVIEAALAAAGFAEDGPERTITVGFGHDAVMSVAGPVIDAVKTGKIRHFFLIGGCDGAKSGRNYFTDFAQAVPKDCVILTLACGKYRFNKLDFGDIGGIPRLLDIGQCNDAYSAVQIALALSNAFGVGVNELPLSLVLSWYEQKAAAILG